MIQQKNTRSQTDGNQCEQLRGECCDSPGQYDISVTSLASPCTPLHDTLFSPLATPLICTDSHNAHSKFSTQIFCSRLCPKCSQSESPWNLNNILAIASNRIWIQKTVTVKHVKGLDNLSLWFTSCEHGPGDLQQTCNGVHYLCYRCTATCGGDYCVCEMCFENYAHTKSASPVPATGNVCTIRNNKSCEPLNMPILDSPRIKFVLSQLIL